MRAVRLPAKASKPLGVSSPTNIPQDRPEAKTSTAAWIFQFFERFLAFWENFRGFSHISSIFVTFMLFVWKNNVFQRF